jgi:hypothetical protein
MMVTRKWEWVARERNKQLPLTRQISLLVICTCLKTTSLSIGTPFPVAYKPIREPCHDMRPPKWGAIQDEGYAVSQVGC